MIPFLAASAHALVHVGKIGFVRRGQVIVRRAGNHLGEGLGAINQAGVRTPLDGPHAEEVHPQSVHAAGGAVGQVSRRFVGSEIGKQAMGGIAKYHERHIIFRSTSTCGLVGLILTRVARPHGPFRKGTTRQRGWKVGVRSSYDCLVTSYTYLLAKLTPTGAFHTSFRAVMEAPGGPALFAWVHRRDHRRDGGFGIQALSSKIARDSLPRLLLSWHRTA